MDGILDYFKKEYPDYHYRDIIECDEPISLNDLSKEWLKKQLKMRTYKYNINTHMSTVSAEIYYEKKSTINVFNNEPIQITVCSKSFMGNLFKTYPNEKQLIKAKEWALYQCDILNNNQ